MKKFFGPIATIIVYVGFWIVPDYPIPGIILLLFSNFLWCVHFIKRDTPDWFAFLWQAGFVVINIRWLILSY